MKTLIKFILFTEILLLCNSKIYTQNNFNNLDSIFLSALKNRIILGVSNEGGMIQQVEHLYSSPKLKDIKHSVWAGAEAKIINTNNNAYLIEVLSKNILHNNDNGKQIKEGYVSDTLKNMHALFDVLKVLYDNRENSDVICKIENSDSIICLDSTITINLTFQNTSNQIRTIHIFTPKIRNKLNGIPLNSESRNNHQKTIELEPNQAKSASISTTDLFIDNKQDFYLYIKYSVRKNNNYIMMISDFIDLTIK